MGVNSGENVLECGRTKRNVRRLRSCILFSVLEYVLVGVHVSSTLRWNHYYCLYIIDVQKQFSLAFEIPVNSGQTLKLLEYSTNGNEWRSASASVVFLDKNKSNRTLAAA